MGILGKATSTVAGRFFAVLTIVLLVGCNMYSLNKRSTHPSEWYYFTTDGTGIDIRQPERKMRVDLDLVPIASAAHELAARDGVSALQHALSDGEDLELILAVPSETARHLLAEQPLGVPLTHIGTFVAGTGL